MSSYLSIIAEYLSHHPMVGLIFTYFIAMVESIAILGTIVPGVVTMTLIGTLIGSGILPLGMTLFVSIIGALTGDFISYWFGIRYRNQIYQIWPFNKYQKLMKMGESFFAKHGGKSVIIGRFVGPVRSMIPLIAGLLQMRLLPFSFAALISATAWSIIYLFPGIFLGALSMELPKAKAAKFLGYALLWIFLIWASIWIIQYFIRKSWKHIDIFLGACWRYLKEHPKMGYPLQFIVNPKDPHDHRQFVLLFLGILSAFLFIWIAESVYVQGVLTELDLPLFNLLQSIRTRFLDHFMNAISFLGDHHALMAASAVIAAVLLYRKAFWMAAHWIGVSGFIFIATKGIKWLIHAKRPELYAEPNIFSSFPSGHVSLFFALFGFSAILIATELPKKWRQIPYAIVAVLATLVACSRIYLGVHWLSDVLGAFFLSLSCILLFAVSYRRRANHVLSARFLGLFLPCVLIISCVANALLHINEIQNQHRLTPKPIILESRDWWEKKIPLPLYRENRFGKPTEPLNLTWSGHQQEIRAKLLQKGWTDEYQDTKDFKTMILKNLIKPEDDFKLPIISPLYHYRSPKLVMTRRINTKWIILELWNSDIHFTDKPNLPLWIGVVYQLSHPHKWFSVHPKKAQFKDGIAPLLSDISAFTHIKTEQIPASKLPKKLQKIISEPGFSVLKIKFQQE